ncbi:MAG: ThiF family adenylyltransferase, partial [Candidatus Xenobia bacterium]
RGDEVMARLRNTRITVCGAGALGANLVETLARCGGAKLAVIDRDRVEERNLSTQPWYRTDVGAAKAKILANSLYRALNVKVEAMVDELTPANATKLLRGSDVVVDAFDNSASRQAVKDAAAALAQPCLHAGLAAGYGEVMWSEVYRVPSDANDDVCDYPLARTLVLMTVSVTVESLISFISTKQQRNFTITLADLTVSRYL